MQQFTSFLRKYSYYILSGFLILAGIITTFNGIWIGDFWEQVAVVQEWSEHLLHPVNPMYGIDAPHHSFSPYLFTISIVARALSASAVSTLSVFGILNLIFFLTSFYLFVRAYSKERTQTAATLSLIAILFLWGFNVWPWSNFLHFNVFFFILPYPAFFATALMFLCWTLLLKLLEKPHLTIGILLCIFSPIIALTHQLTFVFLCIGYLAFVIEKKFPKHIWVWGSAIIVSTTAGLLLWPYFSLFEIILSDSQQFHVAQEGFFYQQLILRLWPLLFTLPFVYIRIKKNQSDALLWMTVISFLLYITAFITNTSGYGRVIAYTAVSLQLMFGLELTAFLRTHRSYQWITVAVLVFFMNITTIIGIHHWLFGYTLNAHREQLFFLNDYVKDTDVILTDRDTAWFIPSIRGYIVAPPDQYIATFVPDEKQRRIDVDAFFSKDASRDKRITILHQYNVQAILIAKHRVQNEEVKQMISFLGDTVYEDEWYALITNMQTD